MIKKVRKCTLVDKQELNVILLIPTDLDGRSYMMRAVAALRTIHCSVDKV